MVKKKKKNKGGILGKITPQGDPIINSHLGRSWWVVRAQACDFWNGRFASQPCPLSLPI